MVIAWIGATGEECLERAARREGFVEAVSEARSLPVDDVWTGFVCEAEIIVAGIGVGRRKSTIDQAGALKPFPTCGGEKWRVVRRQILAAINQRGPVNISRGGLGRRLAILTVECHTDKIIGRGKGSGIFGKILRDSRGNTVEIGGAFDGIGRLARFGEGGKQDAYEYCNDPNNNQ